VALIAGTTVGGGFLAVPTAVVVPLGGFLPSATSMVCVWAYLLVCSFGLCDAILLAKETTKSGKESEDGNGNNSMEEDAVIGIPKTAQLALGTGGSRLATLLLVSLTMATLVSQLSRAGSLYASAAASASTTSSIMVDYRIGCTLATILGAAIAQTQQRQRPTASNENKQRQNSIASTTAIATAISGEGEEITNEKSTSFVEKFNALLTLVFLGSAVLLFQAGSSVADWSALWKKTSAALASPSPLFQKVVLQATPILLQLLVYGEILPNVCQMLNYHRPTIRKAILVGSMIPLVLLTGWAGLGVGLLATTTTSATTTATMMNDPVDILLTTGSSIQPRLVTLALSAIGTTILGSFLALQSAYDDWMTMLRSSPTTTTINTTITNTGSSSLLSILKQSWVRTACVSVPPLLIAWISPQVFLRAIDFAGSYPILLLYGVLPPLMIQRLTTKKKNSGSSQTGATTTERMRRRTKLVMFLSAALVGINLVSDLGGAWMPP